MEYTMKDFDSLCIAMDKFGIREVVVEQHTDFDKFLEKVKKYYITNSVYETFPDYGNKELRNNYLTVGINSRTFHVKKQTPVKE